jgi:formylglycine-generating enzyme required for sulfatase activity
MYRKLLGLLLFILLLSWAGDASAQTTQNITLKPGFNFISFSVSITLTPAGFKALNSSIEDIYLYSPAAGSFLSANEGTLSTLGAGKGYIVKNSSLVNVSVAVPGTALSTLGNISLKSGFNLVGFSKAPGSTTAFTALMNTYSFVQGLYKWSAAAGSFISVVRDNGGVPVKLDGVDPSFGAGDSYFFNLSEDTLLNYDGASVLMGKTIVQPPVTTDNPFAGTYSGTFVGNYGPPQGTFTLTVSAAGALSGSGYNNSNNPPTVISPSGTVSNEGAADFNVTFNNQHKFAGNFTAAGASGIFYETDGTTIKGSWSASKNQPEPVAAPVITPSGGTFDAAQSVTISCATPGAIIKYTTDGSAPSAATGTVYSGAISVSQTTTIKALAIKSGMSDSDAVSAVFIISLKPSSPETITIDLGGITLEMVKINAAGKSFQMGSPDTELGRQSDEGPLHTVSFTKDYYIGKYEVTQAQWLKIYGSWPGTEPSSVRGAGDKYPAYYVSWNDICGNEGFLDKINAAKPSGYSGFRLPTEAEWEYAARGGTQTRFYWDDDLSIDTLIGEHAWYDDNSDSKTHPVGEKQPNPFGLRDMSGNLSEWCGDRYGNYSSAAVTDPTGSASGSTRVIRGGGFNSVAVDCRSARRSGSYPTNRDYNHGFRLVLSPGQ